MNRPEIKVGDLCKRCEASKYDTDWSTLKVGDWVEIERKGKTYHKQVILIDDDGFARVEFSSGKMKIADIGETSLIGFKTIRKLDPSEVVIRIGCLSGTVELPRWRRDGFNLITKHGRCWILLDALDAPTRELVESLLKASGETETKTHPSILNGKLAVKGEQNG